MTLAFREGIRPTAEQGTRTARRRRMGNAWQRSGILRLELSPEAYAERKIYDSGAVAYSAARVTAKGKPPAERQVEGLVAARGPVEVAYNGDILLLGPGTTITATWMSLNTRLAAAGEAELPSIFGGDMQPSAAGLAQAIGKHSIDGFNFGLVIERGIERTDCVCPLNGAVFSMMIANETMVVVGGQGALV